MDTYYDQINQLVQDLLIPARVEKTIDKKTFECFYEILVKLENEVQGEEKISRKIVGLLFFIYCSLSDEVVSYDSSREFADNNLIEFVTVEGADHRFHDPKKMDVAIKNILEFFAFERS